MRGPRQSNPATPAASAAEQAARAAVRDPAAQQLLRSSQSVGNDELQRRIQSGNATRDELLTFLVTRLQTLREVQIREVELTQRKAMADNYKDIADSMTKTTTKPDPERWREPARIYEEAARRLCAGSIKRGAELVDRAVQAERRVFEQTTSLVKTDDLLPTPDAPSSDLEAFQATIPPCDLPEALQLAADIQLVTSELRNPPNDMRVMDPWWTEEEEEEEEKPNDAGAG